MKKLLLITALMFSFAVVADGQIQLSSLPEVTVPSADDSIPIVSGGSTKRVKLRNLMPPGLFSIDYTNNQVSVGWPAGVVPKNRKFYVLQSDTDGNMSGPAVGHNAIEARYDAQQTSFSGDPLYAVGIYGTAWWSATSALAVGGEITAIKGNAYTRPGSAAINGSIAGGTFRVRLEGSNNTAAAYGVRIHGLDNSSSAPIGRYVGLRIDPASPPGPLVSARGIENLAGPSIFSSPLTIGANAGPVGALDVYTSVAYPSVRIIHPNGTTVVASITGSGDIAGNGVKVGSTSAAPTCNAIYRGFFYSTYGGTGVKDSVQVCAKDAADVYAWRTIY